ncbi:hypothetical protein VCRA217O17_310008 [Vibrio crassostreae]|nr:hypothetical protein VCRA2119O381_1830003 [Vibrio crassostreae]CAK3860491.1 hypothetical protein VCRA217O17_310008 [Vibrio crassostreae]
MTTNENAPHFVRSNECVPRLRMKSSRLDWKRKQNSQLKVVTELFYTQPNRFTFKTLIVKSKHKIATRFHKKLD